MFENCNYEFLKLDLDDFFQYLFAADIDMRNVQYRLKNKYEPFTSYLLSQ